MSMDTNISLSIDKGLLEKIDSERGLISRSAYVENILKKYKETTQNAE